MQNKYKIGAGFFHIRDFSTDEIVSLTGVKPATARRYRQTGKVSEPVKRLLCCAAAGFLVPDNLAKTLHFNGDKLIMDTGESFSCGELLAWHFNRQALETRAYSAERQLAKLKRLQVIPGRKGHLALAPPAPAKARIEPLKRYWR